MTLDTRTVDAPRPGPASVRAAVRHPVAALRWLWGCAMTPGRPGRATTETELRWLYGGWLLAFGLKMLGSSWDVSWHFRWLRDDLAPPHLLNSAGTVLVVALVVVHSYSGRGVDRRALRWMQVGTATFLLAVPVDIINHRVNGLDITSWSPSHMLLYLGTAVMLAGALRGWWLHAAPGRVRTAVHLGLWFFFLENVLFPNQHQEYGVLSLADYRAGHTTAEPQLLDFAAAQGSSPTSFMLPVPPWVHPAWLIGAGLLTLVVARRATGFRWTATLLTAAYLGYRAVTWGLLVLTGFPPSVPPVMLLAGAVLVDLAVRWRVPGWLAGVPVAAAVFLAAFVQEFVAVIPPWQWQVAPVVCLGFALLWAAVDRTATSRRWARRRAPSVPAVPVAAGGASAP
ncbi:hypothetical protein [Klenkia sp. PcliD-1-E]|uniref:hypothetical protein n=1 Tax=Klenkia sp. PcliD-1-E TaxID=2954492 RepID=UPI002097CC80|nr:hypothetical protein [Klenkia sp. PcliD-1-E]MCO7222456.1 hypothetical protein [Klenkia sp. PcliD-1-E]